MRGKVPSRLKIASPIELGARFSEQAACARPRLAQPDDAPKSIHNEDLHLAFIDQGNDISLETTTIQSLPTQVVLHRSYASLNAFKAA